MISSARFILASLLQHWRVHVSVAMAMAIATAVLTGALVVGDSVRESLRRLVLDRLGRIDEIIVADRFFRTQLADELKAEPGFIERYADALPVILMQGTVETTEADRKRRAGKVNVLGIDDMFWSLGERTDAMPLAESQVILNEPLASQIAAKVGDEVILRIGQASQIPADSPLGRKTETTRNRRLTISKIIPAEGLGRFGLRPNQQLPLNAFVATGALQAMLDQPDKVNSIFVAGEKTDDMERDDAALSKLLRPTLGDMGLQINGTPQGYTNLTSTRMLLDPAAEHAAEQIFAGRTQTAFTDLANYIKVGDGKIPYSTVTAVDPAAPAPLGPFGTDGQATIEKLGDREILLNRWAADDLAKQGVMLKPGDEVTLEYFEPESTHGAVVEKTAVFKLKSVLEMTPTVADRNWTPGLPGVTDQKSIANWNPPFPYDDARVRSRKPHDEDEAYWEQYKATPKAFISLAAGRKLWGSRFGAATSVRIVPKDEDATAMESRLRQSLDPAKLGFQFLPVKRMGLQAASGTTPFNVLFVSFSFFIVASAVMLTALLFRLGVEQRASEIGLLMAVGLRWRKVARLLIAEGAVIAIVASFAGLVIGVGYAWLMLAGLTTWWLDAIRTPFLNLYVTPMTLVAGFVAGVIVALTTIGWTLWRMRHIAVRRLLGGQATDDASVIGKSYRGKWSRRIGWSLLAVAVIAATFGGRLNGEAQAGAFFGSGAVVLAAILTLLAERFRRGGNSSFARGGKLALLRLAARNTIRNPRRSVLTIGLIASASFLIVAIGAFRLDPAAEGHGKASGSGGFTLIADSDQPIYQNLNTAEGRRELGFSAHENDAIKNAHTISLRVQTGDDASCLNLYQATQPRAVGVPSAMIERGGFSWAGSLAKTPEERENPWRLLAADQSDEDATPIVLDANTAAYSLHKGLGDILDLTDGRGQPMKARIAGLLKNSIFQGDLLMSESNFLREFPDVNGYRMFLIDAPPAALSNVQSALESTLGDYGFDAETSAARLANFFAVQNTYLSTFQSLGGLGLLLGTFGVAAVQLRSVLERRGELALLRACGFRQRRLIEMVMLENGALLLGGLGVGIVSASIAVLPHLLQGQASLPWQSLAGTLVVIVVVGLIAGTLAAWSALRMPLLPALRGD